jgi:membrane glycosyltransferase
MLDRAAGRLAATERDAAPRLVHRRSLFAFLVVATIFGLLWLATTAIPPTSANALLFLALFAVTLPWSVIGFLNAAIGFLVMRLCRDPVAAVNPLAASVRGGEAVVASTAVLVCIRNESPELVVRNLRPLQQGLAQAGVGRLFSVYLLSDSSDPDVITFERERFAIFAANESSAIAVVYRRREDNAGFKAGNIRDFCERWGADHDFAVVLDADSFMPAETVLRLVRIMQANPALGILQTLVVGMPSLSLFARVFQFGMRLGMRSHTLGAAWWQGDCGPYWGHNAILRLTPFIAHCGLPTSPGRGPLSGELLSHDQVEAVLMRRAGYEVRVLPDEGTSWEENPPTLLEFIRRDLRWCQGNMQYWRLLAMPGLKPVSRFQLLFAILMYLGSPAWIAMIAIGAVALARSPASTARIGFGSDAGAALFAVILLMTFAPKIASVVDTLLRPSARRSFGGGWPFVANEAGEALFMILLSPIMAFAHTIFLGRLLLLRRGGAWNGQTRQSHAVPWRLAAQRLWPQTVAGCVGLGIVAAKRPDDLAFGLLGLGGLLLAIPFAVATASPLIGAVSARLGIARIPEEIEPPPALRSLRLPALEAGARTKALSSRL